MGRAKDIILKVIPRDAANAFVKKWHYSGKVVQNSTLHFGAFLDGNLHGVMQYGSPLDKRKVLPLVTGTLWNEMLELNRMAFDEHLPKNSESRCLAISFRLIRKNAPHVKWILSFSDGTQCGDGAIYRAAGFMLTGIVENSNTCASKFGVMHKMTLESNPTQKRPELSGRTYYELTGGKYDFKKYVSAVGGEVLKGYQFRYIYLLDKTCKPNCRIIPFSEIDKIGAGMYRGEKITLAERRNKSVQSIIGDAPGNQSGEGGSMPT